MNIQAGDVLFVWGDSFIADAIEDITKGPSHVAIFVSETRLAEAQGGTRIHELDASFYCNHYCEVWEDPTLTDEERQRMVVFAKTLYGKGYDYGLIPLQWLHFETGIGLSWYKEHDDYICSTYLEKIAESVGKRWANCDNAAPVDEWKDGRLTKKGVFRCQPIVI